MIAESSIIRASGQWWKLVAAFWTIVAGGLLMWAGISMLQPGAPHSVLALLIGGVLSVFLGLAFACVAVRCQSCGARWVWLSVNGQSARNYGQWLLSLSECPVCHAKGNERAT
jgi:hypothetical protein